jgi:hypothetical protein
VVAVRVGDMANRPGGARGEEASDRFVSGSPIEPLLIIQKAIIDYKKTRQQRLQSQRETRNPDTSCQARIISPGPAPRRRDEWIFLLPGFPGSNSPLLPCFLSFLPHFFTDFVILKASESRADRAPRIHAFTPKRA